MSVLAICPYCSKTIEVERIAKVVCPECGSQIGFSEFQRKDLFINTRAEEKELALAKAAFRNSDYFGASEHFAKMLDANKNSHAAKYFLSLCDIYLHESDADFDVMTNVIKMIREALIAISRNNTPVDKKQVFIIAMLNETKIIITRRLLGRDELFETDIAAYRKQSIEDLNKLTELFTIDRELIMAFLPEVKAALMEIADCAIKVSYKSVQTVIIGEDLYSPSEEEYKKLLTISNNYCFFAHSLDPAFDAKNYSPDFSRNNMFTDKVFARFDKFDEENKHNAKKHVISDIEEYDSILTECERALRFTYLNCYRSMCSRQTEQHAHLFIDGIKLVCKLLTPRVVMTDKKIEVRMGKFVEIVEWCDMLTRFLVDSYEYSDYVAQMLHDYYENLYEIVNMYFVPEFDKTVKMLNRLKEMPGTENNLCQKFLFDAACCCAPALKKYVDFSTGRDKTREKLVKVCKTASEDFLLFGGMAIDNIEQSNIYRPIMQISNALLEEEEGE